MKIKNSNDLVLVEQLGNGIAKLIFNDPPLNLMTTYMNNCLDKALDEIAKDKSIRVVVVMGAGDRAFSAGAHVKEFSRFVKKGTMVSEKLEMECFVNDKLARLPQPTIVALHGITLGGGIEVALCCDYRIMGKSVSIGYPEIKLGLFPGGGGLIRLQEIIGKTKAKEMLFFGESVDSAEALRLGLVNEVLPDDEVLARAMERAEQLAKMSGESLKAIKKGIDDVYEMPLSQGIEYSLGLISKVLSTKDAQEGVNAFIEKRDPVFNQ